MVLRWPDIARFVAWSFAGSAQVLAVSAIGLAIQAAALIAVLMFWR